MKTAVVGLQSCFGVFEESSLLEAFETCFLIDTGKVYSL